MIQYTHRIAGVTIRTESDVSIPHIESPPYDRFMAENGTPQSIQRIRQFTVDSFTLPTLDSFERRALRRTVAFPSRWLKNPVFRSPEVRSAVRGCLNEPEMAQMELAWNRIMIRNYARNEFDLFYPPEKRKSFADPDFTAGYRNLIHSSLIGLSAVLIHGAAVARNGSAYLFLAPDSGGKSTAVSLIDSGTVLSDDQVVLRLREDGATIDSTPFGAVTDGPNQAKLAAIFLLRKAPMFKLERVDHRDVLQFIWNEHLPRWCVLPKDLRLRAFDIIHSVCLRAKCFRMDFAKDTLNWERVDAAVGD